MASIRHVWFVMVMHHVNGWTRVGNAYATRKDAIGWLPIVRGAWRGSRVKVERCKLRFVNGRLDDDSLRRLDKDFNMDAPNDETQARKRT